VGGAAVRGLCHRRVLQLTGRARLLGDREIAVRVEVDVRETPRGIPLRFGLVEASGANP
jgi:hypothetical protein